LREYKGCEIGRMPVVLNVIYLGKIRGMAYGSKILLARRYFNECLEGNPSVEALAICEHECSHIRSIKKEGALRFALKYWGSRGFRYKEEREAIGDQMRVLKKKGMKTYDAGKKAKALSGLAYLFCVSRKRAEGDLIKLWEEA